MYDLSTAEEDTHTNHIPLRQKLAHAIHFGLEIVFADLDGELDFLQPRPMLGLALALLLLVVVLAIVYDLADDWLRLRSHFHEIQTLFLGNRNGFITLQYAQVLARIINDSDFTLANPFIDSQFSFVDPNLLASGIRSSLSPAVCSTYAAQYTRQLAWEPIPRSIHHAVCVLATQRKRDLHPPS